MIYNYKDCIKKFGSYFLMLKAINNKKIYKIEEGIYSDTKNPGDLAVFIKKHKHIIFTMESALYYLGICDEIPEKYVIASNKDGTKYKSENIKQYFIEKELLDIGVIELQYFNTKIKLYNKERMLIEIIRYKNKLPYDFYKEAIAYYRENLNELNTQLIFQYSNLFPKSNMIKTILASEVF